MYTRTRYIMSPGDDLQKTADCMIDGDEMMLQPGEYTYSPPLAFSAVGIKFSSWPRHMNYIYPKDRKIITKPYDST